MRLKIRCDGECEKFCKFFWELNKAKKKVVHAMQCDEPGYMIQLTLQN